MRDAEQSPFTQVPVDQEDKVPISPDLFPLRLDLERRAVVFVPMSRQMLRRCSFLDPREIVVGPDARCVDLDRLRECVSSSSAGSPMHFILHGAFCGSTLLARHFEELPHCLVLKEPHLLAQVAKLGNTGGAGPVGSSGWTGWFDAALGLLSRTDAGDVAVVIKAPDQVNWLADRLLDRDQRTKIIFLCAPLRVFLLSVLKSEDRREWLRSRGRGLRLQLTQLPLREQLVWDKLPDAQLAAALWLLNSFLCSNLLARSDSERILVMSSEDLIHRPREMFHQAVEFLGLARDEDIRSTLGGFSPINYYSKQPDVPGRFDAATRGAILSQIDQRFGQEVDAAVAWGKRMSADWLSRGPFAVE